MAAVDWTRFIRCDSRFELLIRIRRCKKLSFEMYQQFMKSFHLGSNNIHVHGSRTSCFCTAAARANTQQTQNVKAEKFRAQRLPRYRYSGVYKAHSRSTAFQSSLFPAFIFVQKIFEMKELGLTCISRRRPADHCGLTS